MLRLPGISSSAACHRQRSQPCPARTPPLQLSFRKPTTAICASSAPSAAAQEASTSSASATEAAVAKYKWTLPANGEAEERSGARGRQIMDLPVDAIRRPLGRTRANDQDKVAALMASIQEVGLKEPIDVLEVDGVYYGFSGCHRYEAHTRLGLPTITCRVRKANQQVLKMHMM